MSELCENLGHAANGWPATRRVRRADGEGTISVCEMCAHDLSRADRELTINCRNGLVWVDPTHSVVCPA